MPRSERIATYIFYFKRTSGHKDIISWSPPFHLHCCPIAVDLFRQTVYTTQRNRITVLIFLKVFLKAFLYTVRLTVRKCKKFSTSPICHIVAESNRCVPGLATAESRVLKLEELAKICSMQYWSFKNSVFILILAKSFGPLLLMNGLVNSKKKEHYALKI